MSLPQLRMAVLIVIMTVRYGWKPVKKPESGKTGSAHPVRVVTGSKGLETFFYAPNECVDLNMTLQITFDKCPLLCAPLLLFFLKRQGFSRCRAWKVPEGLAIRASR